MSRWPSSAGPSAHFSLAVQRVLPSSPAQLERSASKTAFISRANLMNFSIELTDVADEEVRKLIVAPLIEYNISQAGRGNGKPVVITIKDETEQIVGGLWGYTGYEWLFTQLLVVPEAYRGTGVGSKIMAMAEAEAVSRGCIGAWLDTFEFQARGFYERIGYECFAELPNYPTGFSRFFMKKVLHSATQ